MVRFKRRYVVVEFETVQQNKKINYHVLKKAITDAILLAHGEFGFAVTFESLSVKHINVETNTAVLCMSRHGYPIVAASLPLVGNSEAGNFSRVRGMSTITVASTIKNALLFLKQYHAKQLKEKEKDPELD